MRVPLKQGKTKQEGPDWMEWKVDRTMCHVNQIREMLYLVKRFGYGAQEDNVKQAIGLPTNFKYVRGWRRRIRGVREYLRTKEIARRNSITARGMDFQMCRKTARRKHFFERNMSQSTVFFQTSQLKATEMNHRQRFQPPPNGSCLLSLPFSVMWGTNDF